MLSEINQASMDFQMTMYFRQVWKDDRLAFGSFTNKSTEQSYCVDSKLLSRIWRPDTFFADSKEQKRHRVIRDNVFVDISSDGQVMVSELGCQFFLVKFYFYRIDLV